MSDYPGQNKCGTAGNVVSERNPTNDRTSQIDDELQYLINAVESLAGRVGGLDRRLASVLRDPLPTPTKAECEPIDLDVVPLANIIRSQRINVHRIIGEIESILDRLEL